MDKQERVIYLYLHSKVGEVVIDKDRLMSIHEVGWRLGQWRIPKVLWGSIIKVWEDMKIIKKVDARTIEFIKTDFNLDEINSLNKDIF